MKRFLNFHLPIFLSVVLVAIAGFTYLLITAPKVFADTVTFDAAGTGKETTNATSATFTTLTVGTGSNRALVAQLAFLGRSKTTAPTNITVTWDSGGTNQAMTLITNLSDSTTSSHHVYLYGLVNPTSGNKTLSVSWTGTYDLDEQAVSWTGVDQTGGATSFPNATSNSGTSNSASVVITSATGDAVMDVIATGYSFALNSVSATQTFKIAGAGSIESGGSRAAGASTVTQTGSIAGSDKWIVVGTDIKAASAATATPQAQVIINNNSQAIINKSQLIAY